MKRKQIDILVFGHENADEAQRVANVLRDAYPSKRIWDPKTDILPGDDWDFETTHAVSAARAAVIIGNNDYAKHIREVMERAQKPFLDWKAGNSPDALVAWARTHSAEQEHTIKRNIVVLGHQHEMDATKEVGELLERVGVDNVWDAGRHATIGGSWHTVAVNAIRNARAVVVIVSSKSGNWPRFVQSLADAEDKPCYHFQEGGDIQALVTWVSEQLA